MRNALFALIPVLAFTLAVTACSDDKKNADAEPFATLQACYDEHHGEESLPVQKAIVVCCLDHPIADVHPSCKATQADCVAHVTAQLPAVTASDIEAACATYINEKK